MDKGTLYQLKNVINRTSVPNDPADNMRAAEDFLLVILHAHVIAACERVLESKNFTSVATLADAVVASFTLLEPDNNVSELSDGVFVYACDILTLGLLWLGFYDSTKEGDGERIMRYWKALLPIFRTSGRKNYSIEAVNIQLQLSYLLSPRQAAQLVWSRFINTHGRIGCNIPCDLHLEHLNRRLKTSLSHAGSNITPTSVVCAGKCIGVVNRVCNVFENETRQRNESQKHPYPAFTKDYQHIIEVLREVNLYTVQTGRTHSTFGRMKSIMENFNRASYIQWVTDHIKKTGLTAYQAT